MLGTTLLAAAIAAAGAPDAEALLAKWCDSLAARQIRGTGDCAVDGAILCPGCGFLHGRIVDAAWPLSVLWKRTGDGKYLKTAELAVEWCERNVLRPDGSYWNDRKHPWRGTTVFSAVSFARALESCGDRLPHATRERWRAIMLRQAEFLLEMFSDPSFNPNVNYPAVGCEAFARVWKATGDGRFRRAADGILARVKGSFTENMLLEGEGGHGRTRKGCAYVDIGYNMEESLPSLAETARLLGDEELEKLVLASAAAHLPFILPDGGIDNSMGARFVKWSYWGSRTSDGVLPLLAFLARKGDAGAAAAARRVLELYGRCTGADGLLAGGLHYADADEAVCIHHTFAHAKSLAAILEDGLPPRGAEEFPRKDGMADYPEIATCIVNAGVWRATFTASDAFCGGGKRDLAVSGGGPSLLWHEAAGPVLAASAFRFRYAEPMNLQDQRHESEEQCMAPRIETDDGAFSSAAAFESAMDRKFAGGVFTCVSTGMLSDVSGNLRGAYSQKFELDSDRLSASVRADVKWRYVLPVVAGADAAVALDGRRATVSRKDSEVTVSADRDIRILRSPRGERSFATVPGFMYVRFAIDGRAGEGAAIQISVKSKRKDRK